jgi:hypothetical protein
LRQKILQNADEIVIDEIRRAGLYRETSQAFAVLLPVRSVGVMGDERTYENVCAVRAVTTTDFMTADWFRMPYDVLDRISRRIVNEVRGINRVVYDILEAAQHHRVGVRRSPESWVLSWGANSRAHSSLTQDSGQKKRGRGRKNRAPGAGGPGSLSPGPLGAQEGCA